ncbi:ankyrin [Coprinopsis marcescibilis]|nr:ankyrin [Coprinopsis marcescibilis]
MGGNLSKLIDLKTESMAGGLRSNSLAHLEGENPVRGPQGPDHLADAPPSIAQTASMLPHKMRGETETMNVTAHVGLHRSTPRSDDALSTQVGQTARSLFRGEGDTHLISPTITDVKGNYHATVNNYYRHGDAGAHYFILRITVETQDLSLVMHTDIPVDIVRSWLSDINFRPIQKNTYKKWTPGTLGWVLEDSDFCAWFQAKQGIIWGTGMPGAGKTVLASFVINHLLKIEENDKSICVAFAYCRHDKQATAEQVLGSLIRQQVEHHPSAVLPTIMRIYERCSNDGTSPSQEDLLEMLRAILSAGIFSKSFYVVDGLDEASTNIQVELIDSLASLPVNVFITSRPLDSLQELFPAARVFHVVVRNEDIVRLIEQKLRCMHNVRKMLRDDALKSEVVSLIIEKSSGMFLLASLLLDILASCVSARKLRDRLESLPEGVHGLYATTIGRVEVQENSDLARRVLTWTVFAARSLTIEELRYAVAVNPVTYKFDPEELVEKETLVGLCCGLITVDPDTDLVRLIQTTSLNTSVMTTPHALLATTCVACLNQNGLSDFHIGNASGVYDAWDTFGGLHVIAAYNLVNLFQELALYPSTPPSPSHSDSHSPRHSQSPHLEIQLPTTSSSPAPALATPFVDLEINSKSTRAGQTPLMVAANCGHIEMVRLLMGVKDVRVGLEDKDGATALMHASREGHMEVVWALISPWVSLGDSKGRTALMMASTLGHVETVKVLCRHSSTDINAVDQEGYTALKHASEVDQTEVVKALLDVEMTEVNGLNAAGKTALMLACSCSWFEAGMSGFSTVKELLRDGRTDVNRKGRGGRTVLIEAVREGQTEIVGVLLGAAGVDVDVADDDGRTALSAAKRLGGSADIIAALVQAVAADVNAVDAEGRTPLMHACCNAMWKKTRSQCLAVVDELLAIGGVKINTVDHRGRSALIWAAKDAPPEIVERLLQVEGVDVNVVDAAGRTALLEASERGHTRTVRLLLNFATWGKGHRRNAADVEGTTALMMASCGATEVVEALLSSGGINVNAADCYRRTALMNAAEKGKSLIIKRLLAVDCIDSNARDLDGTDCFSPCLLLPLAGYVRNSHGTSEGRPSGC